MANTLLFLVVAGLTIGVIVAVFVLATRGKRGPQQVIARRAGTTANDDTPAMPTSPAFTPSSNVDEPAFNGGGGSFGGGGADGSWSDPAPNTSDSNPSDSVSIDSGSSDSSSSSDGGDSGGSSSDSSS